MKQIILGSQSPRRKELLKLANYDFEVIVADVDETIPEGMPALDAPEYLAQLKAKAVQKLSANNQAIIITADTLVICNQTIFGKPKDKAEAIYMLEQLSGNIHYVATGVCILNDEETYNYTSKVAVSFKQLSTEEINFYVNNYEVMDKAGAYAIQEWIGLIGIEKIEGDYYSVMGLPVNWIYTTLKNKLNLQPFL